MNSPTRVSAQPRGTMEKKLLAAPNRWAVSCRSALLAGVAWWCAGALQATTLTDVSLLGTANRVEDAAELTIVSGGSLTADAGSVVDLFNATVALPESLSLKNLSLTGTSNQLGSGASLTLTSGSTFTAAAGSTVDLSAAETTFPTTVVLTTGSQTLTGKTLVSPIMSSVSAPAVTSLTLSGGSNGARITLGQGATGVPEIVGTYPQAVDYTFLKISNQNAGRGPNVIDFGDPFGQGGERNPVMGWGYNQYYGGILINPNEPGLRWNIEGNYNDGSGTNKMETYVQYVGVNGRSTRPLFFQFDRTSNLAGVTVLKGDPVKFLLDDDVNEAGSFLAQLARNSFTLYGPTLTNDTTLGVVSAPGRTSILSLQFGGGTGNLLMYPVGPTAAALQLGAQVPIRMYSNPSGSAGAAIAVGADDATAVGMFAVGNSSPVLKGLVVRGRNSQIGNLFEVQNGSSEALFAITPLGAVRSFSTGTALSTTTGSFIIGNNVGLSGAAGGTCYFGGDLNVPTGKGLVSGGTLYISAGGNAAVNIGNTGTNSSQLSIINCTATVLTFASNNATFGASSNVILQSTTEATTGGSGSLTTAGGIFAARKIVTASDLVAGGNLSVAGGSFSGGATGLALNSSQAGQPITFKLNTAEVGRFSAPNGNLLIGGSSDIAGSSGLKVFGTTASTSTTTGAFQVVGGAGVGGALNVGGTGFFGGKLRITNDYGSTNELGFYNSANSTLYGAIGIASSSGALSTDAAAQDLVVRSQAALRLTSGGATDRVVVASSDGAVTVTSTTDSASTETGALVVAGGVAVQKKASLQDDLLFLASGATTPGLRVSRTAAGGAAGVWFSDGGSPAAANAALTGSASATTVNAPSGGTVSLRVANDARVSATATAVTVQNVPLNVSVTTASTSNTTGSATFAGGIGVAGRTSTDSLAVGNGAPLTALLSTNATFDFPAIAGNGGVQDLTIAVNGATVGSAVNVVESSGAFAEAGLVVRAIVTGTGVVTVRATNVTSGSIDPEPANYRVTVARF